MTKSNLRMKKMNLKPWQGAIALVMFFVTGCSHMNFFGDDTSYREDVSTETADCFSSPSSEADAIIVPPAQTGSDDFVNYRQSAADYREVGERTPREQVIVMSGPGSNMAAAIPPTIEEEVTDYEEEISAAIEEASEGEQPTQATGEDPVEDWLAEEGSTLKGLLTDWSERAGWRLIWNSNRNYTLAAGAMFRGRFADVSSALIRTFARAKPAPVATFYKGNRVLVVETMEDENAYN